jgi:hypothetical protein
MIVGDGRGSNRGRFAHFTFRFAKNSSFCIDTDLKHGMPLPMIWFIQLVAPKLCSEGGFISPKRSESRQNVRRAEPQRGAFTLLSLFPPVLGFRFPPGVGASRSYEELAGPKKCETAFLCVPLRSPVQIISRPFARFAATVLALAATCTYLHQVALTCGKKIFAANCNCSLT